MGARQQARPLKTIARRPRVPSFRLTTHARTFNVRLRAHAKRTSTGSDESLLTF